MSDKFGLTPEAEKKIRDTLANDVKRIANLEAEVKRLRRIIESYDPLYFAEETLETKN